MKNKTELTVSQVAEVAECHRNTVYAYEGRGLIRSMRDRNNCRWFPLREALKLRDLLTVRINPDNG